MRVCMILEGSYPYVYGGVSSWMHQYIKAFPEIEFVLWCIGAKEEDKGKFKFEIPENVVEIKEVFLDSALRLQPDKSRRSSLKLTASEIEEIKKLFVCKKLDWEVLFELFHNRKLNPVNLLTSKDFLNVLIDICRDQFPYISFVEYFHTVRSMLLPELYLFTTDIPNADIYHATATGYSGLLGSLAKWKTKKPFILTEHGIYTREREEEMLRAKWVLPYFKQQWIDLFYLFSDCAYQHANRVTALFHRANDIQHELGCDKSKLLVIPNGIHIEQFSEIELRQEEENINIGALVRIAKIKDIKTLIYAFAETKIKMPNAVLYILGDVDDKEYMEECKMLIDQLKVKDIIFTGIVDVKQYMKRFDFTVLSSISEGQPLSVLESLAAGRPCVTTDVGCCRELIEGNAGDKYGVAGICVPPMHKESLATAMVYLSKESGLRRQMGISGKQRVQELYTHKNSMAKYKQLYLEVE